MPEGSLGRALLAFSHYQTQNIGVGMIATMAWFKIGRVTDRNLGARHVILDVRRDLGVDRLAQYHPLRAHEVSVSLVA